MTRPLNDHLVEVGLVFVLKWVKSVAEAGCLLLYILHLPGSISTVKHFWTNL